MDIKLKIWRQEGPKSAGSFVDYNLTGVSKDMSFLEMLDFLNKRLIENGDDPVVFEHDCREGICGSCALYINGRPHGPDDLVTTCELRMTKFNDGDTIVIEPWRAKPFPVIKDLIADRHAFDKIMEAGGFISVNTGSAPEANSIPVPREKAEEAFDAAACIGCGACVAACKNSSAMLFVAAKVSHLALLPQGRAESGKRARAMLAKMDELGFGSCTNTGACEAECPKGISLAHIARLNREFLKEGFRS
ncbi:MAG: succinate dehydrogenase/fumarate reductase iron-sulfur subunit [Marinilabiliales bacterium]|nr:MAG: succinate dehydrogenase/fumarate reductase iron-sulfur subunit [Marinilabiliales bacterium]